MLSRENFTLEHIKTVRDTRKIDPSILERSIYALGLLEALVKVEMPFIFKGGTSLMLLTDKPKRLSTDIDIIVAPGTDISSYIEKASEIYPFTSVTEDVRKARGKIVKSHYKFTFFSEQKNSNLEILLDVLFDNSHYSKIVEREIKTDILISAEPYLKVRMPSAGCILGDKLTAFAPHTTGIPLGIGKELEIIKQLFDVATLSDIADDSDDIRNSFLQTVQAELYYRELNLTYEDVLKDTIDTAICIASRGSINEEEYRSYLEGIKGLSNHVYDEKFGGEQAATMACRIIYIAACLLTGNTIRKIGDYKPYLMINLGNTRFSKLSYFRKTKPEALAYVAEAAKLLGEI